MNRTIRSLHRQRGLTLIGWTLAILLFAFSILCMYRIAPPYFDNWQIQSALESLDELTLKESEYEGASNDDIRGQLSRFFQINNISSKLLKEVKITRTNGRVYVDLNWEYRADFMYNIDVVIGFENQFDSLLPTECCKPQADTSIDSE